jgi:GNAT superfamily N-acetyltransferase
VPVEIRTARAGDALAIAEVHVAAWRAAYAGIIPEHVLAALSVERRAKQWRQRIQQGRSPIWVAALPDVQGFVSAGDSRDADSSRAGEVYALYVAPESWGRGVGQRLFSRASAWLAQRYEVGQLWVLAGNERARRFYRRQGWEPDGVEKHEQRGDVTLHEVRLVVDRGRR